MGKTRSALLAAVAMIAALLMTMLPGTASASGAAPSNTPTDHYTASVTAAASEIDQAVAGSPPSGLPCVATTGATACFEAYGDKWWVKDTDSDSASAEALWQNFRGGSLYRDGICRNSLGNGTWGVCNKNYYEDSSLAFAACVFDVSADDLIRCSDWYW
jgi:hypothetical protein